MEINGGRVFQPAFFCVFCAFCGFLLAFLRELCASQMVELSVVSDEWLVMDAG